MTSEPAGFLRILSHCLSILLDLRQASRVHTNKKVDLKLWEPLLQRLQTFKDQVKTGNKADDSISKILALEEEIVENLTEEMKLLEILQNFFLTCLVDLNLDNLIRQSFVRIIEPRSNLDNPIRFTSGLTHAVNIDVWLDNIEDIANIYIKIVYPDHTVRIHKPQAKEFTTFSSFKHHLVCKVTLSHNTWTEPSHVKLSIVQGHPTDIREEIFSSRDSIITDQNGKERAIRSSENYTDSGKGYIDLSPVVRVYIQPKAVGR